MIKKKYIKKIVTFFAVVSAFGTVNAFAEDNMIFISDGNIVFTQKLENAQANKKITLTVTDEDYVYTDEAAWKNSDENKIVYLGDAQSDNEGNVSFNFKLNKNGIYNVYLGGGSEKPRSYKLEYTNKTANDTAVALLNEYCKKQDINGIKNLLDTNRFELRLYSDLYNKADLTDAAKLISENQSGASKDLDTDTAKDLIQKAFIVVGLNKKQINSIDEYKDELGIVGTNAEKYYKSSNAASITQRLQKNQIKSINEYDELLLDAILTSAVNKNDGTDVIENILNDYKSKYSIKRDITVSLCKAVANKNDYETFSEVASFANSYKEEDETHGGSSSAGGSPSRNTGGSSVIVPPSSQQSNRQTSVEIFRDVEKGHWASDAINNLYYKNIVNGKSADEFYPNDSVKREEFVSMLIKTFKINIVDDNFDMEDVKPDNWYYDAVKSAYSANIVNGISDKLFGAGMNITRQDLSVMIYNALSVSDITLSKKTESIDFDDKAKISDYAKEAVEYLQQAEIISGYPDNTFRPQDNATRAEAAVIIFRLLDFIK